jgi:hypothetical protein
LSWLDTINNLARQQAAKQGRYSPHSPSDLASQLSIRGNIGELMTLPELEMTRIQDLDPASSTFGEFIWMLDFDDLGT